MALTAIGVGSLVVGGSIYQGQKQAKLQKQQLADQENAQKQATTNAIAAQRRSDMAYAAANRKKPDIGSLLGDEQLAATKGMGETMLTPPGGVGPDKLTLGKTSLLGE